jgi:CIC family chloride channel protein
MPTGGALLTGFLLYRFFPEARGSGIPQTKSAIFIREGYISLRTVLGKFLCCTTSLASGIALGREGPSVHIGAGIASVLARGFGLGPDRVKALIPVGCAAALAAAFNTPIAAVLFSLEEILGDLHARVLGTVVLSSATSWAVLHLILGDEPLFHVPGYQLVHPAEFVIYACLGVIGGLGSVVFVKLLLGIRLLFRRFPTQTIWCQPAVGGLAVGIMALWVPEVLGVGYDFVERVLGGDLSVRVVVLLAILKIIATALCYSSGNAGGIFGPSLFIGAMIGGAVGSVAHTAFPQWTAAPGAYALLGMGTAFAGIVRSPLTSVIMIFEMTRDYSIIVPLMISNLVGFFVSQLLQHEPIYDALARQEGVYLPLSRGHGDRNLRVMNAVRPLLAVDPGYAIGEALDEMQRHGVDALPVSSPGGIRALATKHELDKGAGVNGTRVGDLFGDARPYPYVHADESLSVALQKMGAAEVNLLPVVSRANIREATGVVTLHDILAAFRLRPSREDR